MTWRSHVLLGVGSLWLLSAIPGVISDGNALNNAGLLAACAALGALLPDLDSPASKVKSLSLRVGNLRVEPFRLPAHGLSRTLGHRGMLHSLLGWAMFAFLFCVPIALWVTADGESGLPVAAALLAGYGSHLAADACTRSGIPFLYPSRRRYFFTVEPLRIVTGSDLEASLLPLFALPAILLMLVWLLRMAGSSAFPSTF